MRFDEVSEVREQLIKKLAERVDFYLPHDVSEDDYFRLRESCRFWEGVVDSGSIVEVKQQHEFWHHQIRARGTLPSEKKPMLNALTSMVNDEVNLLEIGPSELANAFHEVTGWLDALPREQLPVELRGGESVVRLLSIRQSFFFGLSFHVESKLSYITPLVFPAYFKKKKLLSSRTFVTPARLVRILGKAPSFFGVGS